MNEQENQLPQDWLHTTFNLVRDEDETGVSGTGVVASGIIWRNGKCAMHWHTAHTSTTVYDSLSSLVSIHGHAGKTRVDITGCGTHAGTCYAADMAECGLPMALFEGHEPYGVRSPMLLAIYRMHALEYMNKAPKDSAEFWTGIIKSNGKNYQWNGEFFGLVK